MKSGSIGWWSVLALASAAAPGTRLTAQGVSAPAAPAAQAAPATPAAPAKPPKGVGETPPKLTTVEWVRGAALRQFQRGTIYVLDFWAPWSGESVRTLAALEALGKQHAAARVQLVGVAVRPQPGTVPVETFLEQRKVAGALDYPVARDKIDGTLQAWERLIDLATLPRAVVIDRRGRIAWVGHPFDGLEEALAAIVADDAVRLGALVTAREAVRTAAKPHLEAARQAVEKGHWSKVPAEVDALLALDARLYAPWAPSKYYALVEQQQTEAAAAWGRQVVEGVCHDDGESLNAVASYIAGSDSRLPPERRDLPLALAAARRADELSFSRDAAVLDTLAHAHAALGNLQQAIDCETRAAAAAFSGDLRDLLQKHCREWTAQAAAPRPAPGPAPAPPVAPAPSGATPTAPAASPPATPGGDKPADKSGKP